MNVGKPLRRREDLRLVRGRGQFVDDVALPGMAYIAFVRSPHAHARIRSIDVAPALDLPGVLRIVTDEDWRKAGLGEMVCVHPMHFSDGRKMNEALRPVFASGKVCHVGDVVAAVVAEDRYAAMDGAEAVEIDYEVLASVTETGRALDPDAPLVHDQLGTNLVTEVIKGDRAKMEAAFAQAAHITELTLVSNRISGMPLEPHSFVADHNSDSGETTLWATNQMPHMLKQWLCKHTLYIPEHKLRVITPDMGGSFGSKGGFMPETSTVVWMARELGRPVKWTATRSEEFLSQTHGRDHVTKARMAFDKDGVILGMDVDTIAALGGYLSNFAPSIPGNSYPQTIAGLYRNPGVWLRMRAVYTHTVPVGPYRGSGRPEATWVNERLLENGAREMGIDVAEIRRRNFIQKHQFPYPAAVGRVHDSGDPPLMLEKLLAMAGYDGLRAEQARLRAEQARLRAQGVLMGIGMAGFFEKSATGPSKNLAKSGGLHGGFETATVRVHSDGKATLFVGTQSHGQGHEITYAAIAADRLGIPVDDIDVVEGDTGRVPFGNGTWGSRSASVGGAAVYYAAQSVFEKARRIAAGELDCTETDLDYADGTFRSRTSNRTISFGEVADMAYLAWRLPKGIEPGLETTIFHDPPDTNDPAAMHLAVVLVDERTGRVTLRDYYAVDDAGVVINPMIVEGQIQGGLAQGIGQALMEHIVFDPETGQLLSGTFMDYGMPRSDDMPPLTIDYVESPAPSNPLGAKGGSETGTIGPPAAIGNAVVDALWHKGVRHVELPMTPQTVWRAIEKAKERS
jgi:carbon-monoxide dehydrogenase large subunit